MADHPDIRPHLESESLLDRFEDEVVMIGTKLKGKVRALRSAWEEGEQFTLKADVAGETCEVIFWQEGSNWTFESQCTCEIRSYCPHAAALLIVATKPTKLRDLIQGSGGVPPLSSANASPSGMTVPVMNPSGPDRLENLTPTFELQITREPTESKVVRLLLQALKIPDLGEWVVARPYAIYGKHRTPLGGKPGLREHPLPDGSILLRDTAAETNAILQLQQAGLASLGSHAQYRFLLALEGKNPSSSIHHPPSASTLWFPNPAHGELAQYWPWLRATGTTILEDSGWTVTFDDNIGHEVIDLDPDAFKYVLEDDGSGWFHLSVGFDVGDEKLDLLPILAQLLDQGASDITLEFPAQGNFLHHLDDGRALNLPAERIRKILKQFSALIDPRRFKGSKLKLHPLDAATLSHTDPERFHPPEKLTKLIESFSGNLKTDNRKPVTPPGIQAELRDYQKAGFEWLQFLTNHDLNGILADDMGLGKTLQTITHILAEKESGRSQGKPTLVIAPTSVVPNWYAEIKRFAPALSVLILDGPQRKKYFRSIPHADVILTSFALLQRDIDKLKAYTYHLGILDEAQYIKNPNAKVAKAACELDARHRLCLSGTPVENHLGELWSLMRFLMPGFLGGQEQFNRQFRKPIENEGDLDKQAALKARVAPLILRRNKTEVAKELPPKTILVHPIELNTGQKDLY
ncbi:DEAD/DEAH box helicase, partial [Haloferula sp.]|uniref:DEAD/DEAH box helicase n=1 Tax=Haloferula sp. TaxID=2497595 RepID=UPI003C7320AF